MAEPPPPQPPAPAAPPLPSHLTYPDSLDSSPRSRNADNWDDPFAPASAPSINSTLRLMCSYDGHIVPRPHDKSLCYVGGETRMVVVDRHTSLADLSARLSKTFLGNRPFCLRYQIPNEDLDSLISVTTDEDLENMVDEYDRTAANSSNPSVKPSRLRLFLFPFKPDSSQSLGPILDSSNKTEDWFLDALNGASLLNRGFSDSASVNCLLGLDDDVAVAVSNLHSGGREVDASQTSSFGNGKNVKRGQDVHSVPDSPMLETTSSFGSTSSLPSLVNLPPIRVHVEDATHAGGSGVRVPDQKVLIEDQIAQMNMGSAGLKQEEGFMAMSSPPPMPPATLVAGAIASLSSPPLPQSLPPSSQQKSSLAADLPSPDSVSSDSGVTNQMSRSKPVMYQDQVAQYLTSGTARLANNLVDPKLLSDPNTRIHFQQVQEPGFLLQSQFDQQQPPQQQFIQQGTHFIHHQPQGASPISAYYQVFPSQPQFHHQNQLEQQYPVYYMPARQAQGYGNLSVHQSNVPDAASGISSSRPQVHANPSMASPAAYNPMVTPPIVKTEMGSSVYRPSSSVTPNLVQVPTSQNQQQQQQMGYTQGVSHIHHQSQSGAPPGYTQGVSHIHHQSQSGAPPSGQYNYAYEFSNPVHSQIYYTQPLGPSHYQPMVSSAFVMPETTSAQLPPDNTKQLGRSSQPL